MMNVAGLSAQIHAAGFEILGQRPLSDGAWEAYFGPMEARIDTLRLGADAALACVLDEAEAETATCWRARRAELGSLLSVMCPV
ncbi:hypothetical protein [Rhodovulum sp. ES.010]|uniref:hypothetical protein n=1 Tax=Rhodovulum sp. ES.010 TaxID=1882821 RepID=UPI0009412F14|nr:hypothetical protein [Rhodovulum sp. ES.010]